MSDDKYMYNPKDVGREVESSRGNISKIRKYHMSPEEMSRQRKKFEEITKNVPASIKKLAGPDFFNPYRKGIYFGQIQALYLLGANRWHELNAIIDKTQEILVQIPVYYKDKSSGQGIKTNVWDRFASKTPKAGTQRNKDLIGRVQENMVFFQRLTCLHPSGFKLRQVHAAVDMKKVCKKGIPDGVYLYRLSTYSTEEESSPIRDFSEYIENGVEKKYINPRFIGKIILPDRVLEGGKVCLTNPS